MNKIDFKKELKGLYAPSARDVSLVDVPKMQYLMVDGEGAPESHAFSEAIEAIYSVAYGVKFAYKKQTGTDYSVMPMEALWWADDMSVFTFDAKQRDKNAWKWTIMIMQPDFITAQLVADIKQSAAAKKPNPRIVEVRLEQFTEGLSAQIMHIGPFSEEGPNIARIHAEIAAQGGTLTGKHHEIYLSDMRRVAPEKLKTVLRQPYTLHETSHATHF